MPAELVAAVPDESIDDDERAGGLQEAERSLMRDRLGQPFVPMVPAHVLRRVGTILERQVLRVRRFEQAEEPVGPHFVLFDAVDGQRVVKRRTSKQVPRGGIRRVHVAAGIDDERRSRVVILERQLIVVLVIPEAVRADHAALCAHDGGYPS